jgi:hypothetical protein
MEKTHLDELRLVITENTRIQQGGATAIEYVDVSGALANVAARQNHVIFGRRGCGKTLLLGSVRKKLEGSIREIYINCEDYKQHSFPNVLIEILDRVFSELHNNLSGWFGRKAKTKKLIAEIRSELASLKSSPDQQLIDVKHVQSVEGATKDAAGISVKGIQLGSEHAAATKEAVEKVYKQQDNKIETLNILLPRLKSQVRDFFIASSKVKAVFIELDDFYHLKRTMQPHITDYIHRLCKDVPLYFKIATLRHASSLYADRGSQPTGAQERHDYQPINLDFNLADFAKTSAQLRTILYRFGELAGCSGTEMEGLFKGQGFDRMVLAAGGVPRDFLALLLEALARKGDSQDPIGKDDVRLLSSSIWKERIDELKADSEEEDQDGLLRGIYAIQKFCVHEKRSNVFLIADRILQERDDVRELLNRLLDYRIIHSVASALTHKSLVGTFQAYMIDIGAYANLRKLADRFTEIDITPSDSRERLRNSPVLDDATLQSLYKGAPERPEPVVLAEAADMEP